MQRKEIESILARYRQGKATEEDRAFLESWYLWDAHSNQTSENYQAPDLLADAGQVWSRLNRRPISIRSIFPYAAAVLVIVFLGIWWQKFADRPTDLDMEQIIASSDGEPTITLSDGSVIPLDKAQTEVQMGRDVRYADGTPIDGFADAEPQELLIKVPTGTTYQLLLADSTRVWLNAGSSLRYPSFFTDDQRTVELEGEAYFEVRPRYGNGRSRKSPNPFVVKTDKQTIEVLGTHFNVKAYPKSQQRTTLLEGKVQLAQSESNNFTILQPGQEAIIENTQFEIREVDAHEATSWVSGLFSFDNKSFKDIMEEVSLWYDLEVVYEGARPKETFFGQAYRSDNLATVLRLLESAQIKYRVNGDRQLIISNRKEKTQ